MLLGLFRFWEVLEEDEVFVDVGFWGGVRRLLVRIREFCFFGFISCYLFGV